MDPVYGAGEFGQRATAAMIGPGPENTMQLGADNSEITDMRAAVGAFQQAGAASAAP